MPRIDVPFVVELQSITQPTNANLVAGGQNYFYATFNLCETWKKISDIKAVFSRVDIEPIVVPLEQGADYMECKIPWEVMQTPGVFHVGVFGGDRLPTHYAYVRVKTGCVTEGDAPLPPTPDWFEKIAKKCDEAVSTANSVEERANNGEFDGKDGSTPVKGVDYYTEEEKTAFVSEIEAPLLEAEANREHEELMRSANEEARESNEAERIVNEDGRVAAEIVREEKFANMMGGAKLKLLKTITLEEDVKSINVEFDKPVDEVALLFEIAFVNAESGKSFATRTDSGVWYMFWSDAFAFKTTKQFFSAHAKEIAERQWETFVNAAPFGTVQGISTSATTARLVRSRRAASVSRYLGKLNIFIPNNTSENMFATGSVIEIWGHEVDE